MPCKMHILEINVLGYLQRVAMLKVLKITMLEKIVIVVTESSDLDRVASMSCLQKVAHKIEHLHEKTYENVYVWSDGLGSQSRSHYIFKLLASKSPMDGI